MASSSGPPSRSSSSKVGKWTILPSSGTVPPASCNHTSVISNKSTLMVMGGESCSLQGGESSLKSSTPFSELFLYKSRQWTPGKRHNAPPGVTNHASIVWGSKYMTFGGRTSSGLSNEMWTFNEGSADKHTC